MQTIGEIQFYISQPVPHCDSLTVTVDPECEPLATSGRRGIVASAARSVVVPPAAIVWPPLCKPRPLP